MHVTVWSDYCCPWCYLALDREALLEELGATVTVLPFELHPDTPAAGRRIRPGGRSAAAFAAVGAECEQVGLAFRPPERTPNTRRVLEVAEHVRRTRPDTFPALHRGLFATHFAEGRDLGDPDVLDGVVAAAGADSAAVRIAVDRGVAAPAVAEARALATEHGVAGTPAFLFDSGLLVPGVQPRASLTRWVTRMTGSA